MTGHRGVMPNDERLREPDKLPPVLTAKSSCLYYAKHNC
jgi:hypothetical protein